MLANALSVDDLVIMGDGLLRRIRPACTLHDLSLAVAQTRRQRGHLRLHEALALVRPETDSARETMLRLICTRAGFPEPELNGLILNAFGAPIAHGDLVYRKYQTILEYDGGHHREDERQFHIDIVRLDELMEENWRVIRVDKQLMARTATLLGKIETALERGGWHRSTR
jgi:hypothetical protein